MSGPRLTMSEPLYKHTILNRPDFAFLYVHIPGGQTLMVEGAAMATMSTNLKMKTKLRGGLGRLVTGESIFMNEFTAEGQEGEIGIAPGAPGDMEHLRLKGNIVYLQNSAFVAATPGVIVESKWRRLRCSQMGKHRHNP